MKQGSGTERFAITSQTALVISKVSDLSLRWLQSIWTNMFFLIHTLFLKCNHYISVTWKMFTANIYYNSFKITPLLETNFTRIGLQAAPHRKTTGYISPSYKSHQNLDFVFLDHRVQAHRNSKQHFSRLAPTSHTSCFNKQVAHIMSWTSSTAFSSSPVHVAIPLWRQTFLSSRYPDIQRCPTRSPFQSHSPQ